MVKQRLNLTVDGYLIELARKDNINISEFLENSLSDHFHEQIQDPESLLHSTKLNKILRL